jgi:hypothetical protein
MRKARAYYLALLCTEKMSIYYLLESLRERTHLRNPFWGVVAS